MLKNSNINKLSSSEEARKSVKRDRGSSSASSPTASPGTTSSSANPGGPGGGRAGPSGTSAGGGGAAGSGTGRVGRGSRGVRARSAAICGPSPSSALPPRSAPSGNASGSGSGSGGGPGGATAAAAAAAAPPTRSLSEFYYAGRGAAPSAPRPGCDIQLHLQAMFGLLRPQDTLKMAVRLESDHPGRTRYLVVVSCMEESCLLGIDCSPNSGCSIGLVLRVLANAHITLDGDGGFSVTVGGSHHIFKPVSVQAMWSALQTLYRVCSAARERNLFLVPGKDWAAYYEERVCSDRSCLNEWNAMDSLESRRPPSPGALRSKPSERCETERVIRATLKEIMMSVDLDEVTSKYIRGRLEEQLNMDLGELKSFIDGEMLTILGQMDAATEIFDHVYLGSEWNASNLEELQKNGVRHIVNVTREIDNFFPGMFNYLNVRVYDDEKTDLLKHWDDTFKYISRARDEGSKVLVHCKMGVSRSASVVIAYAMKAYNWDLKSAFSFVHERRTCIKPNTSFISQLETYQGILDAMKNREKLQRSKSETNLKSPGLVAKAEACSAPSSASASASALSTSASALPTSTSTMLAADVRLAPPASTAASTAPHAESSEPGGTPAGDRAAAAGAGAGAAAGGRPRSWSPSNSLANCLLGGCQPEWRERPSTSASMEHLNAAGVGVGVGPGPPAAAAPPPPPLPPPPKEAEARNVRLPCANGLAYSVSQNKVVHLPFLAMTPPMAVTTSVSVSIPVPIAASVAASVAAVAPMPVTMPVSAPVAAPAPPLTSTASQLTSVCRRPRHGPRPWHTSLPALPARTDPDDESVSFLSVSAPASASAAPPGKVRNLKKEFEAAAAAATAAATAAAAAAAVAAAPSPAAPAPAPAAATATPSLPASPSLSPAPSPSPAMCLPCDSHSVPSSPVARHSDPATAPAAAPAPAPAPSLAEDFSVRVLVGKYEPTASQPPVPPRNSSVPRNVAVSTGATRNSPNFLYKNLRNGCWPRGHGHGHGHGQAAPTVSVSTVTVNPEKLASVVAKAASKKQQQGKTHPLAQLGIGKVPPQVYNTM